MNEKIREITKPRFQLQFQGWLSPTNDETKPLLENALPSSKYF
jgi:hypothetical protein